MTTTKTGTINNTIEVKRTDFEVFDALRIDSEETADISGESGLFPAGGGRAGSVTWGCLSWAETRGIPLVQHSTSYVCGFFCLPTDVSDDITLCCNILRPKL